MSDNHNNAVQAENTAINRPLLVTWLFVALMVPCLSAFGRPMQQWLSQNLGQAAIAWLIGILLVVLGAGAVRWLVKRQAGSPHYSVYLTAAFLAIAFLLIITYLPQSEERLHFFTFGLLGFFSQRLFPARVAIVVILVCSGGDELFQAWLPDRVADWRDVFMNILGSTIGIAIGLIGDWRFNK